MKLLNQSLGLTIIIAHIERYTQIRLKINGFDVLTQINAYSLFHLLNGLE